MKIRISPRTGARIVLCAVLAGAATTSVRAQEALNTDAATQPSAGVFVFREQLRYTQRDGDPTPADRRTREFTAESSLTYGFTSFLAGTVDVPATWERVSSPSGDDAHLGIADITLSLKARVYRKDSGPLDTLRIGVIGGAEVPTGDSVLSSDSVDPFIGAVLTTIRGRHGFSQAVRFKYNGFGPSEKPTLRPGDGGAGNALYYDSAYLYRVDPAAYTAETSAATYAVVELNGLWETAGQNEILISPGILYEGRSFALEAGVQLPVWRDLDSRPGTEFSVVVGVRLQF